MAIREVWFQGYRSVRSIRLPISNLTVFVGPNGTGKSNLYRAMMLLSAAARGDFARILAAEGGMPSVVWAGPRRKGPVRVNLGVVCDEWRYTLEAGLPMPSEAAFKTDPIVKAERVELVSGRRPVALLERSGPSIWVRGRDGKRTAYEFEILGSEAALSRIRDPESFPELSFLCNEMSGWRFYHHFRTDLDSPVRQPQVGVCTPELSSDGHDLAAVFETVIQIGDPHALHSAIDEAFPGAELDIAEERGRYEVGLQMPGIHRPFEARELSDGTLRYLCLLGALMSHRLPSFIALNEPETSIHVDLYEPLAHMIVGAAERTQIWVITHAERLAAYIEDLAGVPSRRVTMVEGETQIEGLSAIGRFSGEG